MSKDLDSLKDADDAVELDYLPSNREDNLSDKDKLVKVSAALARAMMNIEEKDKQLAEKDEQLAESEVEKADLREKAYTDSATEIANRRSLDEKGPELIKIAQANKEPMAAFLLDANYLKLLNKRKGHEAGTELLRAIATALKKAGFSTDIVARLGGDEFMLLAVGFKPKEGSTTEELTQEYYEIIDREVAADIKRRGLPDYAGASIGHTMLDLDDSNENLSTVLSRADASSIQDKERRKEKDGIKFIDERMPAA